MPTPTPREERRLEDACQAELLAGVREVEAERANIVTVLGWLDEIAASGCFKSDHAYKIRRGAALIRRLADPRFALPTEAELARAWTAADPPADESAGEGVPPC